MCSLPIDLIQAQTSLRSLIRLLPDVTARTGQRVWIGPVVPDSYDPTTIPGNNQTGPGVLLTLQAGQPAPNNVYLTARLYSQSIAQTQIGAWELDSAVVRALENRAWPPVRQIRTIQTGVQQTYTGTDWPDILRIFEVILF
jgi:hypothetical protein